MKSQMHHVADIKDKGANDLFKKVYQFLLDLFDNLEIKAIDVMF